MLFYKMYNPITAAPFRCSESYVEVAPCEALRPYVRCFWGTKVPVKQEKAFAEDSLRGTKNGFFDAEQYFSKLKKEIEPLLFDIKTMEERVAVVEKILLNQS